MSTDWRFLALDRVWSRRNLHRSRGSFGRSHRTRIIPVLVLHSSVSFKTLFQAEKCNARKEPSLKCAAVDVSRRSATDI